MNANRVQSASRRRAGLALAAMLVAAGCSTGSMSDGGADSGNIDGAHTDEADAAPVVIITDEVDLLMVVDNSGSMAEKQLNLMAQLGPLVAQLTTPPCVSRSTPGGGEPHACRPGEMDDVPVARAVRDLHVGVISTDLGTGGMMVPGCDDASRGDDGRLNPIRNGYAQQTHLPWAPRRPSAMMAPPGFRPAACTDDPNQFPSFITYCSNSADPSCPFPGNNASTASVETFSDWFKCNVALYINGCGLESQLEATWRALVQHEATNPLGGTGANAGFLRIDAVLAIVMFTDEEDGSVRVCANDQGFSAQRGQPCSDGADVYNLTSMAWAHPTDPDLRFYLYQPGSERDPNWDLDRYVNTASPTTANRWNRDLLSLKPGLPQRIVFAAITGVPLQIPVVEGRTNWDALLGPPALNTPNAFYRRDDSQAISGMQGTSGPFSMRAANMDPMCSHVVPACRSQGTTYDPTRSCSNSQPMAFPSRRIVEVARRFDEAALCNGQPCRNGIVSSICASSYGSAVSAIAAKIASRLGPVS